VVQLRSKPHVHDHQSETSRIGDSSLRRRTDSLADARDAITGMRHDLMVFVDGCAQIREVRLRGLDTPYGLNPLGCLDQ
jgi:hypothetical protein